jgi:hypothetical protein
MKRKNIMKIYLGDCRLPSLLIRKRHKAFVGHQLLVRKRDENSNTKINSCRHKYNAKYIRDKIQVYEVLTLFAKKAGL